MCKKEESAEVSGLTLKSKVLKLPFLGDVAIKRELDPSEIFNGVVVFIGAIIVFFSITLAETNIAEKKVQLELARELPKLIPMLRNNYTNQVSSDEKHIEVRAVLRVASTLPTYIHPPFITLVTPEGDSLVDIGEDKYEVLDVDQFQGSFASKSEYHITYNIQLNDEIDFDKVMVKMSYLAELPNSLQTVYKDVYEDIPDSKWEDVSKAAWKMSYGYTEKIYRHNQNEIWDDFWENPR